MIIIFRSILFLSLIILFFACNDKPPVEEKMFIKIYSEMIFMQDTSFLSQSEIKSKVLRRFKISKTDFDATIKYYNNKPERWQKFFDSTIVYIDRLNPNFKKPDSKVLPKRSVSLDRKNPLVKNP